MVTKTYIVDCKIKSHNNCQNLYHCEFLTHNKGQLQNHD